MPSKGKKPRPQPSSHPPPSPRTPPNRGPAAGDLVAAAAAAKRYPAMVSGDRGFAGAVAEVGPRGRSEARVSLSEAAMVAAALRPGCLVSVSLLSSSSVQSHDFPLVSLVEECTRYFSLDVDDDVMINEVGEHFVIATVFPSREVQKNDVKLSWDLACMLGFPSVGRAVLVSPVCTSQVQQKTDATELLHVGKCKDLYLSLVPPKIGYSSSITSELVCSLVGNGKVMKSPKTPSSTTPCKNESHDYPSNTDPSLCLDTSTARSALADERINELLQICASRWLNGRHLLKGNFVTLPMCGKLSVFLVKGAELDCSAHDLLPMKDDSLSQETEVSSNLEKGVFLVDRTTKVHISILGFQEEPDSDKVRLQAEDSWCNNEANEEDNHPPRLGGLSEESAALKEIISFSLAKQNGLPRYKGVLLYGPPGTGKTSLACSCARDAGASLFTINGPEIISQYYGESEQALYDVFSSARQAAPSVIFIDELDAIAPARKDGSEELSLRMVATLLKLMDEIGTTDRVLLIAATNRPDSIDPALRRPGRLDREIEIGVPSPRQRQEILDTLLKAVHHCLTSDEIQSLALATHGFVGADLAALCNEAALSALRRYINLKEISSMHHGNHEADVKRDQINSLSSSFSKLNMSSWHVPDAVRGDNSEISGRNERNEDIQLIVTTEDFEKAKTKVRPSAMREVMLELPKIKWDDVGGQVGVKKQLIEAIQWPQKCPEAFERIGIRPPRGLLMIGPPGCSKTLMARAVASEAKLNFLAVKGPELFSKWVGESEKAVRSLFAKARANAPAIIFFDEIDGLAITRGHENDGTSVADRVLSQLLVEMDGLDQRIGVTVIAATNRPDKIDHALLRPGRFDRVLDVQPPDETDRADIFRIHTRSMPCSPDVSLKDLASLTEGYTGADIKLVCREAAVAALEESFDILEVAMRHFKLAITRVKPSDMKFYRELAAKFRRFVDDTSRRDQ